MYDFDCTVGSPILMLIVKLINPAVLLDKKKCMFRSVQLYSWTNSYSLLVVLLVLLGSYLKAALQLKKGKGGMNGPIPRKRVRPF